MSARHSSQACEKGSCFSLILPAMYLSTRQLSRHLTLTGICTKTLILLLLISHCVPGTVLDTVTAPTCQKRTESCTVVQLNLSSAL